MADTNSLEQLLNQTKQEINTEQKALAKAQEDLQRRNEKKAALEAMLAEAAKSAQAIQAQRTAAEADLRDAHMALAGLKGQLEKTVPQDIRTQTEKIVASVEGSIEKCRETKSKAEQRLGAADQAKRAADNSVAESEAEYQVARAKLQQLVGEIGAARTAVGTFKEKAKTATADGRVAREVWWLVPALEAAIDRLGSILGQESARWGDLEAKGRTLEDNRDRALEEKRGAAQCRAELEEAETKLKEEEQGREKAIQEQLQKA